MQKKRKNIEKQSLPKGILKNHSLNNHNKNFRIRFTTQQSPPKTIIKKKNNTQHLLENSKLTKINSSKKISTKNIDKTTKPIYDSLLKQDKLRNFIKNDDLFLQYWMDKQSTEKKLFQAKLKQATLSLKKLNKLQSFNNFTKSKKQINYKQFQRSPKKLSPSQNNKSHITKDKLKNIIAQIQRQKLTLSNHENKIQNIISNNKDKHYLVKQYQQKLDKQPNQSYYEQFKKLKQEEQTKRNKIHHENNKKQFHQEQSLQYNPQNKLFKNNKTKTRKSLIDLHTIKKQIIKQDRKKLSLSRQLQLKCKLLINNHNLPYQINNL